MLPSKDGGTRCGERLGSRYLLSSPSARRRMLQRRTCMIATGTAGCRPNSSAAERFRLGGETPAANPNIPTATDLVGDGCHTGWVTRGRVCDGFAGQAQRPAEARLLAVLTPRGVQPRTRTRPGWRALVCQDAPAYPWTGRIGTPTRTCYPMPRYTIRFCCYNPAG